MARPIRIVRTPMAQAIRRFRAALGDTQRDFAKRTGLTITSISRYEINFQPSRDVLITFAQIAAAANLRGFVEIFEGARDPDPAEFKDQELDAIINLLDDGLDRLESERTDMRKARLLLAIELLPASKYAAAEETLRGLVSSQRLDETINRRAGELIRPTSRRKR